MIHMLMPEGRRTKPTGNPTPKPTALSSRPPARFCRRVVTHLVRNFAGRPGPRLLVLNGPPGVGKTHTVQTALKKAGCCPWKLSATTFESVDAGEPAKALEEKFREARENLSGQYGKIIPVVIVVEDADRLLAPATALTQTTFNTQQINALLLSECDRAGRRAPVVFTTNSTRGFDPALLRPMRTDLVQYELTRVELKAQVIPMFPTLLDREVEQLLRVPVEPTIAFFADLKRAVGDLSLTAWLSGQTPRAAVRAAITGELPEVVVPSFRALLDAAVALEAARHPTHHLEIDPR